MIKKMVMDMIKQLMAAAKLSGMENSFLMLLSITFIGNLFDTKLGKRSE